MKLINKFLTALAPVAMVGVITPTLVACNKNANDYLFNYEDHINCRDKDDENYHSLSQVKSAAKIRAQKASKRYDYQISDIDPELQQTEDQGRRFYFFDLIASYVIIKNEAINLKDWKVNETEMSSQILCDYEFNLNGTTYPISGENKSVFTYDRNKNDTSDRTIYLFYRAQDQNPQLMLKSYVFSDCLWEEV